jgi:purine-binding chemotaxis protein CheW
VSFLLQEAVRGCNTENSAYASDVSFLLQEAVRGCNTENSAYASDVSFLLQEAVRDVTQKTLRRATMGEEIKVIVFGLADEEYGIEVEKVRTIERMIPITRVPKTPAFIKGVINLRGVVLPVIDLRGRFGLSETEPTENSRIVIVAVNDLEVGFIVDAANDVIDIDSDSIDNPPEVVGGIQAKYLRGVAKLGENRLLIMLNLAEVLKRSEIIQLEQLEE